MLPEDVDEVSTPPPAAIVTPAPATVQPVSPPSLTPGGTLQPVGLTPLAHGGFEPSVERFALKVMGCDSAVHCCRHCRSNLDPGTVSCRVRCSKLISTTWLRIITCALRACVAL